MRRFSPRLLLLVACLLVPLQSGAQTHRPPITVSSATVGKYLVDFPASCQAVSVWVEAGSTSVWFGRFPAGANCGVVQTASIGKTIPIPANAGWIFLRPEETFTGVICGILDVAGTATVWVEGC